MNTNVQNFLFDIVITAIIATVLHVHGYTISWLSVAGIFLISYPWKMPRGDVYSLWGGCSDEDIYSLFGVYQNAKVSARSICGFYQVAGNTAVSITGVLFSQRADTVVQGVTVSVYQNAKCGSATQWGGVSFYQTATSDAIQFLGVSFVQYAIRAFQFLGICVFQLGEEYADQTCGIILIQIAERASADQFAGIAVYQEGGYGVTQKFGIPLWQRVVGCADD